MKVEVEVNRGRDVEDVTVDVCRKTVELLSAEVVVINFDEDELVVDCTIELLVDTLDMVPVLEDMDIEADVVWEDSVPRKEVDVDDCEDADVPLLHKLVEETFCVEVDWLEDVKLDVADILVVDDTLVADTVPEEIEVLWLCVFCRLVVVDVGIDALWLWVDFEDVLERGCGSELVELTELVTCVVGVVVPNVPKTYVVELVWNVVCDEYGEVKADELLIPDVRLGSID